MHGYLLRATTVTYRRLRDRKRIVRLPDTDHYVLHVVTRGRSRFKTKLLLILWIFMRWSRHIPMRHGGWRTHVIYGNLLIIEFFLVNGHVILAVASFGFLCKTAR